MIESGRTSRCTRSNAYSASVPSEPIGFESPRSPRPSSCSPSGLSERQRDVRAQHVVGALEDREDPDVAQDPLVRLAVHVALAALELHRAVGRVPDELGAGDLRHRRLDGVVLDARRRPGRSSGTTSTRGRRGRRPSTRSSPRRRRSPPSGLPNWRRVVTCSIVRSSRRLARPTAPVPSPRRPLLSTAVAMRKPSPGSPSTFSGGTRTSLKRTGHRWLPRRPSVL